MSHATKQQSTPIKAEGDVWLLVMKDMEMRRAFGFKKYGVPVQAGNGRDALIDAYQEALDLCVYLRQAIEERELGREKEREREKGKEPKRHLKSSKFRRGS